MSSGPRQRIGIDRALAAEPELIICDEPVGVFDITIQTRIFNRLMGLQDELDLTHLFTAHDLRVVNYDSGRATRVVHLGQIIKVAEKKNPFSGPEHPYTRAAGHYPKTGSAGRVTDRPSGRGIEPISIPLRNVI